MAVSHVMWLKGKMAALISLAQAPLGIGGKTSLATGSRPARSVVPLSANQAPPGFNPAAPGLPQPRLSGSLWDRKIIETFLSAKSARARTARPSIGSGAAARSCRYRLGGGGNGSGPTDSWRDMIDRFLVRGQVPPSFSPHDTVTPAMFLADLYNEQGHPVECITELELCLTSAVERYDWPTCVAVCDTICSMKAGTAKLLKTVLQLFEQLRDSDQEQIVMAARHLFITLDSAILPDALRSESYPTIDMNWVLAFYHRIFDIPGWSFLAYQGLRRLNLPYALVHLDLLLSLEASKVVNKQFVDVTLRGLGRDCHRQGMDIPTVLQLLAGCIGRSKESRELIIHYRERILANFKVDDNVISEADFQKALDGA